MKKAINNCALAFILSFLIAVPAAAASSMSSSVKKSPKNFKLDCIVGDESDALRRSIIEVYEADVLVETYYANKNGEFKFRLEFNSSYTLKVKCEGYYDKDISFNTTCNKTDDIPEFSFSVLLYSKTEYPSLAGHELLTLPAGIVFYSPKRKMFLCDKTYSKDIVAYYEKVILEADENGAITQAQRK